MIAKEFCAVFQPGIMPVPLAVTPWPRQQRSRFVKPLKKRISSKMCAIAGSNCGQDYAN